MKKLAHKLEIDSPLGRYVARKTFSRNRLQQKGSINLMFKLRSLASIEANLGGFEDEQVRNCMEFLV